VVRTLGESFDEAIHLMDKLAYRAILASVKLKKALLLVEKAIPRITKMNECRRAL
jgi:hypothetical protein